MGTDGQLNQKRLSYRYAANQRGTSSSRNNKDSEKRQIYALLGI